MSQVYYQIKTGEEINYYPCDFFTKEEAIADAEVNGQEAEFLGITFS